MSRNFSRLEYAAESANSAEVAAYKAWKAKSRTEKSTAYKAATQAGGPRVTSVRATGYIIPLKAEATSKLIIKMKILAKTQTNAMATALNTLVGDYSHETVPTALTNPEIVTPQGRKYPAKAGITEKSGSSVPRKSRITDVSYSAKTTDSSSSPIGKKVVADTLGDVLNDVETKLSNWVKVNADNRTYRLSSEGRLY